ncbi:MAG: protoheme synthesis HemY [Gammaproteobacteria bacterium]|jgi:HemY protein|nr:protoheme synthesis HemY [Gammaproteobacteria bacterium]
MKRFLWVLALLVIAVLVGVGLIELPGYVLVQVNLNSVAMPLWLAVLGILVIFLILFALLRFWATIMKVPSLLRKMKKRRQMQRLQSALESLLNTDWLQAEQHFKKLAKNQFLLPHSQLLAASCAAKAGRVHAQEHYVKTAQPILPQDNLLVELAKLDLFASEENWKAVLAQIQKLKQQYPNHSGLLRREIMALQQLKAWTELCALLAESKQAQILSETEYNKLAIKAYQGSLKKALRYSPQAMDVIWESIPEQYQLEPSVAAAYAKHLLKAQHYEQAEQLLNQAIELHTASAESLHSLAQICLSNRAYEKAKRYAEQSLSMKPNAAAYSILAQVYEQEGDVQKALKTYRQASMLL